MGKDVERLVKVKDALLVGAKATGAMSAFAESTLGGRSDIAPPVENVSTPRVTTPMDAAAKQKTSMWFGTLATALTGATLAVTTILAMKGNESTRWTAISRVLP